MFVVVNALARASLKAEGKFARIAHGIAHSKHRDAEAIRYHYDVSNDFYACILDPGLVYSCAYFERGDESLVQAQDKKINHILRKIRLQPGQRLLDIGCGWGALVLRAARQYGARCVGVTLSETSAHWRANASRGPVCNTWSRSACKISATWRAHSTASPASA